MALPYRRYSAIAASRSPVNRPRSPSCGLFTRHQFRRLRRRGAGLPATRGRCSVRRRGARPLVSKTARRVAVPRSGRRRGERANRRAARDQRARPPAGAEGARGRHIPRRGGLGVAVARAGGAQGAKHDFMRHAEGSPLAGRHRVCGASESASVRIKSVLFPARGSGRKGRDGRGSAC